MEERVTGRAAVTEAVVTAAAEEDEALERSPRAGIPLNDKHIITITDTQTIQWKLSKVNVSMSEALLYRHLQD